MAVIVPPKTTRLGQRRSHTCSISKTAAGVSAMMSAGTVVPARAMAAVENTVYRLTPNSDKTATRHHLIGSAGRSADRRGDRNRAQPPVHPANRPRPTTAKTTRPAEARATDVPSSATATSTQVIVSSSTSDTDCTRMRTDPPFPLPGVSSSPRSHPLLIRAGDRTVSVSVRGEVGDAPSCFTP